MAAIMSHANTLPEQAYCVLGCAMKKAGMVCFQGRICHSNITMAFIIYLQMSAANKINIDNIKTTFGTMQTKHPETYQGFITIFESCQPTGSPSECEAAKFIYECSEPKIKQVL